MIMVRTIKDFVPIWRVRADELKLTHATIDAISGLPDGYFSKVMCGMKKPGPKSVEYINAALAIGFTPVVDEEQSRRLKSRWTERKRPHLAASPRSTKREEVPNKSEQLEVFGLMQILGRAGGKASGKTRRAKAMRRRELQRKRTHAARMRWSKTKAQKLGSTV